MTPSEWAAWIGAAAWLYPLGQQVYRRSVQSKLTIISAPNPQCIFYDSGNYLNCLMVISSDRKDSLIKRMVIHAQHENGETRLFEWSHLNELFPGFKFDSIPESMRMIRSTPALALKVDTASLVEREIGFGDSKFRSQAASHRATLTKLYAYFKTQSSNPDEALKSSQQMADARAFFAQGLYWREGRYNLDLEVSIVGRRSPHRQRFSIRLTQIDIEVLKESFQKIEDHLLAVAAGKESTPRWSTISAELLTD